ncbi:MAG TPA: class I SAM-dependent methyltransferase [Methylomusa anaerophila]|uniref:Chondramide synthase cmdD n=1 Tax=Methylomusa anaerophila TaxID=1930071 RepID=A0A348AES1_9FIRM|nr:class I SAM-dependent methyltransferase [Methylomusa anaerophila]BBB89569.1 chondramide synthase cmdD [Methylomusa anaerophila]HML89657.1 class I SAM-dependent methyltransferase [Methylomusa anaerophila]
MSRLEIDPLGVWEKEYSENGGILDIQKFSNYVKEYPDEIALAHETSNLTFKKVDRICNVLEDYILTCEPKTHKKNIAIFDEYGSVSQIISILTLKKNGQKFKLIESKITFEEIVRVINKANINVILSVKKYLRILNKLLWECPSVKSYICIDSADVYQNEPQNSKLMNKKLWELVGMNAKNEIEGGGWINSYTREYFSKPEMDEYANNIFLKLEKYLNKDKKILEVGCASGISMFKIAPYVGMYLGTDLSEIAIEKNIQKAAEIGLSNVKLQCVPAHEIRNLEEKNFDIAIMNSVIHCFSGVNYLRKILLLLIELLGEKGIIFIGDVMDLNKKSDLMNSLFEFKKNHPQYNTKLDLNEELFLSKEFFCDLQLEILFIRKINFYNKIYSIENELTKFRYDVIIEINKKKKRVINLKKYKYQYGLNIYKRNV